MKQRITEPAAGLDREIRNGVKMGTFLLSCALLAGVASPAAAQCVLPRVAWASDSAVAMRYAETAEWYTANAPITVYGTGWVKYGLPRTLSTSELWLVGEHQGVPVYAEAGVQQIDILYVPVNAACEFQTYTGFQGFHVVSRDRASAPGSRPAELSISGCPEGAELFLFSAREISGDPNWRSQLVVGGAHYVGEAEYHHALVFTSTPQPYDVVLAFRGRAWRYRIDAIPGRETRVAAKPPYLRRCVVPMHPVM